MLILWRRGRKSTGQWDTGIPVLWGRSGATIIKSIKIGPGKLTCSSLSFHLPPSFRSNKSNCAESLNLKRFRDFVCWMDRLRKGLEQFCLFLRSSHHFVVLFPIQFQTSFWLVCCWVLSFFSSDMNETKKQQICANGFSLIKKHCSRAIQLHGGIGIASDPPLKASPATLTTPTTLATQATKM